MATAEAPPFFEFPTHLDLPCREGEKPESDAEFFPFPTHLDLPDSDGKPVDNIYQPLQSMLLTGSLAPALDGFHPDGNYFIGANMGIYWKRTKDPLEGCKVPDWFYVPNVPRLLNGTLRRSYVLWQEFARPLIAIELVSGDGREERDATPITGKFWVYEHIIQPNFYVIHDFARAELNVYELQRGNFELLAPNENGRFRISPINIELGIWNGEYHNYPTSWLRAWDANGRILPTPEEMAELEQQRAVQERNRAEQERNRADKLAQRLRELGIDPDTV